MEDIKFKYIVETNNKIFKKIFTLGEIEDSEPREWMNEIYLQEHGQNNNQRWDLCERSQFTGLKDKEDVEIYKGDIAKVIFNDGKNTDMSVVTYGEVDISDRYYENYIMGYSCGQHNLSSMLDIEVVGNIYENPELLNNE